ncbi:hypothetical protein BJ138DRAFT_1116676 [Hygrophoropsis aurantiaca]|uniref:Uncharacterized protein n=1 Tax=Hygrophoropsis aurantiaca TaxID=72124 RepID=A0ACB8A395_9AGAM|nr:hypothetical protein BJ138DRAFT_1116676 [Hygrophoropsis aurantiaca]
MTSLLKFTHSLIIMPTKPYFCPLEPIRQVFSELDIDFYASRTRTAAELSQLADKLGDSPYWIPIIDNWTYATTEMHYSKSIACRLFVDVLWERNHGREADALQMLANAQTSAVKQICPRPKASLLVNDSDMDSESDLESDDDSDTDSSFHPEAESGSGSSDSNSASSQTGPAPLIPSLVFGRGSIKAKAQKNRRLGNMYQATITEPDALALCQKWLQVLTVFFFAYQNLKENELDGAEFACRVMLRDARNLPERDYSTPYWGAMVKKSGLYGCLQQISYPSTALELSAAHLTRSTRKYQWKHSFAIILDRWALLDTDSIAQLQSNILEERIVVKPLTFLQDLDSADSSQPLIPTASHPPSVFFLMSEACFIEAWYTWLKISLSDRQFKVPSDPAQLYRSLCNLLTIKKAKQLSFNRMLQSAVLLSIVNNTIAHRSTSSFIRESMFQPQIVNDLKEEKSAASKSTTKRNKKPKKKFPTTSNNSGIPSRTCTKCADLPADQQCVQDIFVERRHDVEELRGSIITCAALYDRLPPKMTSKGSKKGSLPQVPDYRHPDQLGLKKIECRPQTFARCQRDVVRFIDKKSEKCVGGAIFKAFNATTLNHLQDHHSQVANSPRVTRGEKFEQWAYGNMVPVGSRLPQGGRLADCYTTYPCLAGDNEEDINMLFQHAYDADVLTAVTQYAAPDVFLDLKNTSADAQMHRLGTTGANVFYCSNYISPQHSDQDASWSLCSQLFRDKSDDEWNFCFTEWNLYIQNKVNTVWWFRSEDLHGSMVPRRSTMRLRGGADLLSGGDHNTIRRRDQQRAKLLQSVRERAKATAQWWETQ